MAVRWWVNDNANNKHDEAGNWSTTEGGAGGASVPGASDDVHCSATSSAASIVMQSNWTVNNFYTGSGQTGGTDHWTGDIVVSGYTLTCNATFDMETVVTGASIVGLNAAGDKIKAATFRLRANVRLYFSTTSTIECGTFVMLSTAVFHTGADKTSGNLILYATGNWRNDADWLPLTVVQNAGVTTTVSTLAKDPQFLSWTNTTDVTINGTLALGTYELLMITNSSGTMTFGANCDVTGTNSWRFYPVNVVCNKTSAFSFSGTITEDLWETTNYVEFPAADFSNANIVLVSNQPDVGRRVRITSGTLKCKDFTLEATNVGDNAYIDNDINNPNIEASGAVDFGSGSGTVNYTKGTGTFTLAALAGVHTVDFNGETIEDLVLNFGISERQVVSNFTCDSLSGAGGLSVFKSSVAATQRTITVSATGVITSTMTIQDIKVTDGSTPFPVSCKSGTNNGNNEGIIFVDKLVT